MQHKGTVTLETPRLILRRFVMDDLEPMFEHCWSRREVWQWTNYAPMETLGDVITRANMFTPRWLGAYEDLKRYSWAIHSKADGHAIGRLFGMHPSDEDVELAYELSPAWWNRGLMTEAVRPALDFFLREVGLHRVHAWHAGPNPSSGRVMQKCGMRYTGTLPGGCTCNAGTFDRVDYELLSEEYLKK